MLTENEKQRSAPKILLRDMVHTNSLGLSSREDRVKKMLMMEKYICIQIHVSYKLPDFAWRLSHMDTISNTPLLLKEIHTMITNIHSKKSKYLIKSK